MNSKNSKKLLSKLAPQQLEVLKRVCKGYPYKKIAEELYISLSSVKSHMVAVYRKLELTHLLNRDERMFQIRSVYCPLLQELEETLPQEQPIQESEPEIEPTPITPEEEEIINGDEKALVTYMQEPVSISGGEEKMKRKKKRTFLKFVLALIMIAFMVFGAWQAWIYVKDVPIVSSVIALINPETSAASESKTSPAVESEASSVTQPEATSIIEPIVSAIKSSLGSSEDTYEIGEWHKEDDLWFRVYEVEISDPLFIYFEIWNKSTDDIYFTWTTQQNISLTDNTGSDYAITESFRYKKENVNLPAGTRYDLKRVNYWSDPLYKENVTELLFSIEYFSRIDKATWRIPVNK